ncbi:MAG: pyrroline-5-carboxylate reductase [Candidatus Peregrinibacteria bacterium]
MMMTISIIGAGNMGSAIAQALLSSQVILPENLRIADPSTEKLQFFKNAGCDTSTKAEEIIPRSDILLLATKPQVLPELLESWKDLLGKNTILLSIAAGVSVSTLQQKSGLLKIVRIMPNTPAQIGMGVSGVYFSPAVEKEEQIDINALLDSFSVVIPCETEEMINAITALSGSGPAYVFRILEIFAGKAEEMGFSVSHAQTIALQTLLGAGMLAKKSGESFGILREKVTSKGGTTAAALDLFASEKLEEVIKNGIDAAFYRAQELSSGK